MINDIKLEGIANTNTIKATDKNKVAKERQPTQDVAISTHLSNMAKSLLAENTTTNQTSKILALKAKIDSQQYKVDVDALAAKITQTLIAK